MNSYDAYVKLREKYLGCDNGIISVINKRIRDEEENMKCHKEVMHLLLAAGFSVTELGQDAKCIIAFDYKKKNNLFEVLSKISKKYKIDRFVFTDAKDASSHWLEALREIGGGTSNIIDDKLEKHHPFVSFQPVMKTLEQIMNS
jgi:hypothetical protein